MEELTINKESKQKVWICTVEFCEEGFRIIHVFSNEVNSKQWFSEVCRLNSSVTYEDVDKSVKAAKVKQSEYEKLGLDYSEWCYAPSVKGVDVE